MKKLAEFSKKRKGKKAKDSHNETEKGTSAVNWMKSLLQDVLSEKRESKCDGFVNFSVNFCPKKFTIKHHFPTFLHFQSQRCSQRFNEGSQISNES